MATREKAQRIASSFFDTTWDKFIELPEKDAEFALKNPDEIMGLLLDAIITRETSKQNILGPIYSEIKIPASTTNFITKDKFKVDTRQKTKVKIARLEKSFINCFLEKIEAPAPEAIIYRRRLKKDESLVTVVGEIMSAKEEYLSLREIYLLMAAQGNGQDGELLNGSRLNIFFTVDCNQHIQALVLDWFGDGWRIYQFNLNKIPAGSRIFSRKKTPENNHVIHQRV